jgi:type II secretory pathway component PulF
MSALADRLNEAWVRWQFRGQRAEFWRDLATMIRNKISLRDRLLTLAAREPSSARGRFAQLWLDAMLVRPDFAEAATPLVPLTDHLMLRAAASSNNLPDALDLLGEQIERTRELRSVLAGALAMPLIGLAAAVVLFLVYGGKIFPEFAKVYPMRFWPDFNRDVASVAMFLAGPGGLAILAALLALIAAYLWSLDRWTGRVRTWMDDHVLPYSAVRDLRGIGLLMALATLLRNRVSLRDAVVRMGESGSRWMAWHADAILEGAATRYASDPVAALGTGVLSDPLYFRLIDYGKVSGLQLPDLLLRAARDEAAALKRRLERLARVLTVVTLLVAGGVLLLCVAAIPQPDPTQLQQAQRIR